MKRLVVTATAMALTCASALAQTSTSYELERYAFTSGATPSDGVELSSAGFQVTLATLGDALVAVEATGGSFAVDVGFPSAFPPPGEVAAACGATGRCLVFVDGQSITWPPERSAGTYNLYRGTMAGDFGVCEQTDIATAMTVDSVLPGADAVLFYLVTVENRLDEEGTKGYSQDGPTVIERGGPSCP